MKSDYVVRAKKFIEKVYPYIEKDINDVIKVHQGINRFNKDYHRNVIFCSGAVRIALVTSDYVVKWDYSDYWKTQFGGCADELKNYRQAVEDGYGYLFAKITRVRCCGKTFYVMPRINNIGKAYWNLEPDEEEYIENEICIEDLHEENYGSYKGKTIIIDYAFVKRYL